MCKQKLFGHPGTRARRKTSLTLFSIQSLGWCARGWLVVWGQEIGIAVSSLGGKQGWVNYGTRRDGLTMVQGGMG